MQELVSQGNELLQINQGFIWGLLIIFSFFLVLCIAVTRKVWGDERLMAIGSPSDKSFALAMVTIFLVGFSGFILHTLLPITPWRLIVLRDLAYHFGITAALAFMIIAAVIKVIFNPDTRTRALIKLRPHNGKAFLALLLVSGFVGWTSFIAAEDVLDFFAAPIVTTERLIGYKAAYRRVEANVYFEEAGKLDVPHGLFVRVRKNQVYSIRYMPRRRLLLSCKKPY